MADLILLRECLTVRLPASIVTTGLFAAGVGASGKTAGNIDRQKYQRLVALSWLTEASVNISDVVYKATEAGKAAALRDN